MAVDSGLELVDGLDRKPLKPLSDTLDRAAAGRVVSAVSGPDVRMKSARSAVAVRLWEARGDSGDCVLSVNDCE